MRARTTSVAILTLVALAGCGDSKGERSSPAAPTAPPPAAAAPTSWKDPKDLLRAVQRALEAGDAARVIALYDATAPAASLKKRYWAALAEVFPVEAQARAAFTKKFGQAAWDSDDNPLRWGTGSDFGLSFTLARLGEAPVDEEDGVARIGIDKWVFHVSRRDGACVAFREDTFGGNEGEVRVATEGAARARKVIAALDAAPDLATFRQRFEELRGQ